MSMTICTSLTPSGRWTFCIRWPVAGRMRMPRSSAAWFGADLTLSPAPLHGEHTDEILAELDYDAAAIAALRQAGTAGTQT